MLREIFVFLLHTEYQFREGENFSLNKFGEKIFSNFE